ncbi:hypothetical protein CMO93_03160 [Candidatus Woesearchaeota archaeon]|nr:hypothetical protein [Candidatus Woesearchaeota archaeon]|tara:strand:+ start:1272 stop:1679 length:408 start_codon:yes stop_codon:yes gene_type:complete
MAKTISKNRISKNKKIIFIVIVVFIILIFVFIDKNNIETGKYGIEGVDIEPQQKFSPILKIANSNEDVKTYLQNRKYSIDIAKVTSKDKEKLLSVYEGLEGELYRVYYKTNDFGLIVITNKKEVLNVVLVSQVKI